MNGKYRTIVADPPWRYTRDPGSLRARRDAQPKGRGRQAEDHYDTLTTEQIAALPVAERLRNVFEAPRGCHSAKPDLFYDLVEQVSPAPRLEMFARRARFGWDYWGDESLGTATLSDPRSAA